jgi:hypothetical protein
VSASLPARAKALRERLARIEDLGAAVEESGKLEDLRGELDPPVQTLKRDLSHRRVLREAGVPILKVSGLAAARQRSEAILTKFQEEPKASTLKKGRTWPQLQTDAAAASQTLSQSNLAAWKAFRDEQFGGDRPSTVEKRLAMTPENAKALEDYTRLYDDYRKLFDALPPDPETVARAQALADDLKSTAKAFDFNVPDDVKAFLAAIQSGGAPLTLLTEDVCTWLAQRKATDDYRIRAKGA